MIHILRNKKKRHRLEFKASDIGLVTITHIGEAYDGDRVFKESTLPTDQARRVWASKVEEGWCAEDKTSIEA